jgi:hypothetical protein
MHNYSCRGGFLKRMLEIGQKMTPKGLFYKGQAQNHSTKKSDQSIRHCSDIDQYHAQYLCAQNKHFKLLHRLSEVEARLSNDKLEPIRRKQILDFAHQLIEHYSDAKKISEKNSDQIISGES